MANSSQPADPDEELQTLLEQTSLNDVCFSVECPSNFAFLKSIHVNKEAVCRLLGKSTNTQHKWLDDMVKQCRI